MAGHRRLIGLLTVLGVLLLGAGAQQTEVKLVGSEVIMVPIYTGNPTEINWKINGNKLVDMELNTPDEPTFYNLKTRATIDKTNGRLTIRGLTIGDSGGYKAEVLVNSVYQYTEITLAVRDCPAKPIITNQTTEVEIVLRCGSSSPDVTYEWFNQTGSVGKDRLYSEPRSNKDVNLTCVVDNKVCKKSSSITILYTPESSGSSGAVVAGILIPLALIIIIILIITLCCRNHKHPCVTTFIGGIQCVCPCLKKPCVVDCVWRVRKRMPYCKGNSTDVEGQPLLESCGCITVKFPEDQPKGIVEPRLTIHDVKPEDRGQYVLEVLQSDGEKHELDIKGQSQVKLVGSEVTLEPQYRGDPSEINWKIDGNKLVDLELDTLDDPTFYRLRDRATIDRTNGRLTIRGLTVEDSGDYKAEVLVNNVYQYTEITLTVRETDGIVIIGTEDDKVTLTVPDTEKVTKITLKKGGVTLFQWKVSDLKLHTNNITLGPGFVAVNNAEGNRSYKVEVHSTDNRIANHKLLEANNQGNESPTNREAAETTPLAENGRLESRAIDSVTFHPINMTNKITWKKDGQLVNIDGKRMKSGPYGDLIINKVTPDDKGKYTVQCEDQKLAQEFILHL